MQNNILETLTRKGTQTSEGKITLSIVGSAILVLVVSLIQGLIGQTPEGIWKILGALVTLIIASRQYQASRTTVKERLTQLLIAFPNLRDLVAPPAPIHESYVSETSPRPIPGELSPSSLVTHHSSLVTPSPLPAWTKVKIEPRALPTKAPLLSVEEFENQLAPYKVVIHVPGLGTEEVPFIERPKACEFADSKRSELKNTPGATVHVL